MGSYLQSISYEQQNDGDVMTTLEQQILRLSMECDMTGPLGKLFSQPHALKTFRFIRKVHLGIQPPKPQHIEIVVGVGDPRQFLLEFHSSMDQYSPGLN